MCRGDGPCVAAGLKQVDSSYVSGKEVMGLDYRKGVVTTLSTPMICMSLHVCDSCVSPVIYGV